MQQRRILKTFPLAMLTVAAIVSLRNLSLAAEFGLASISYYLIAALIFFIPIGLVTAELAAGWPKAGASYIWVSEAFGKKIGFLALWLAWMESVAWFPPILAFSATMLAYLLSPIFPNLEHSLFFIFSIMLLLFWTATFLNFLGIQTSSWISTIGVLLGTLIPGALIIGLGFWWIASGKPTELQWQWAALIPDFSRGKMAFFSGILLSLAGVELAAFHLREAKNPQHDYPRALFIATCIILAVYLLGTLAIAAVVPLAKLSLISGLVQALFVFFQALKLEAFIPLLALFLLIGSLAGINAWTVGPAKGLLVTAEDGFLPPLLKKTNSKGVPTGMLLFQAIIGSLLSLIFLYLEDTGAAFWILTGLAAQFTVIQYLFVFLAALKLRYSKPTVPRYFKVPGGLIGMWCLVLFGVGACLFGFWIPFYPPEQLQTGNPLVYVGFLVISLLLLTALPIFLGYKRDRYNALS